MPTQTELRRQITDSIIASLEKGGIPPWRMGWSVHPAGRGMPANAVTGRKYNGINVLLLQLHARRFGFTSRYFATFNQWRDRGCAVKPRPAGVESGQWGCHVVLYKPVEKTETDEATGESKEIKFPMMRSFVVFSADQVRGAEKWQVPDTSDAEHFPGYEPAETAIKATEADIRFGGNRAFYSPAHDYIQCPPKGQFIDIKEYYGTLFHELAHWSESRLNWKGDYPSGELRAEIAAAFASAELGVPQSDDLTNVNAYLKSWLSALKDDPRYIFTASAAASRAADHILSFSRPMEAAEEPREALAV
ncbi:ArdC-like ssDNA-binding domain-containing protein [Paludisphaera sp.]|uniref:ArdC family protein n=1 Tax=Paludisphaera sp. TaxID=2017432 RepID=UPI00301B807F